MRTVDSSLNGLIESRMDAAAIVIGGSSERDLRRIERGGLVGCSNKAERGDATTCGVYIS